jgi:hypothetical protein
MIQLVGDSYEIQGREFLWDYSHRADHAIKA